MSIYFCFVMVGIFLCEVVDALSNIRRCGETCIELCTLTDVVCFIKNGSSVSILPNNWLNPISGPILFWYSI